jgi:hypothetical protein
MLGLARTSPLIKEIKDIDFLNQINEIKVPIVFFTGKYDFNTPT